MVNMTSESFIGLFAAQGTIPFYNKYGLNKYDGLTGIFGVVNDDWSRENAE
jgi:hypothetical protein